MVGGYAVEGISVGGQETCIIVPSLNLAFDIGRCPRRAVFQDTVLISHSHVDHIVSSPPPFLQDHGPALPLSLPHSHVDHIVSASPSPSSVARPPRAAPRRLTHPPHMAWPLRAADLPLLSA